MIGKDPDSNDIHVNLEKDVGILHLDNVIMFMNKDSSNGTGKVFICIDNEEDLDKLSKAINRSREFLKNKEKQKNKNDYVSFSGQTRFEVQKPPQ